MSIEFNVSKEIMEQLTSNKYPTIFEFERAGQEKIQLVKYEDYLKLHSIIKEVREYIEEKEKNDDNWVDYELLIEPIRIKEILDKADKENI